MKFEEILPLLRDKGVTGIIDGKEVTYREITMLDFFSTGDWQVKTPPVKRWYWAFASSYGSHMEPTIGGPFTDEEASYCLIQHGLAWRQKLVQTECETQG